MIIMIGSFNFGESLHSKNDFELSVLASLMKDFKIVYNLFMYLTDPYILICISNIYMMGM